jgi:hypothetical protein
VLNGKTYDIPAIRQAGLVPNHGRDGRGASVSDRRFCSGIIHVYGAEVRVWAHVSPWVLVRPLIAATIWGSLLSPLPAGKPLPLCLPNAIAPRPPAGV